MREGSTCHARTRARRRAGARKTTRGVGLVRETPPVRLAISAFICTLVMTSTARAGDADPWFGRDKALHFGATSVLAGGGYAGMSLTAERPVVRAAAGAALGLTAGIAKEVYDRYGGGDASWRDLTWDAVGTATGLLVAWLLDRYVF
jgi:putative lipoprotein